MVPWRHPNSVSMAFGAETIGTMALDLGRRPLGYYFGFNVGLGGLFDCNINGKDVTKDHRLIHNVRAFHREGLSEEPILVVIFLGVFDRFNSLKLGCLASTQHGILVKGLGTLLRGGFVVKRNLLLLAHTRAIDHIQVKAL